MLLLSEMAGSSTKLQIEIAPAPVATGASGRLLIFARPVTDMAAPIPQAVDADELHPRTVTVEAWEEAALPSRPISPGPPAAAFPEHLDELPPGIYDLQAVLDRNHSYARHGRGPGDIVSPVMRVTLPATKPIRLDLSRSLPFADLWNDPDRDAATRARIAEARPRLRDMIVPSPTLARFAQAPRSLRAWVLLPPGYDAQPSRRWPVVYASGAYSSSRREDLFLASLIAAQHDPAIDGLIWVFLDFDTPQSATAFADSANNGPWGEALTRDLIPTVDARFRTDPRRNARFLTGHSTGGWASIWLQVAYPKLFGGVWATAPDPLDFSAFLGADLCRPDANFYAESDDRDHPLVRVAGKETATLRDYAHLEETLGPVGGQLNSFEWSFSPRGANGTPRVLFDRSSGRIDPVVARYWCANYDLASIVHRRADMLRPLLANRITLLVGDEDTFYLDRPARRFASALTDARIPATVDVLPGRTHNDLYGPRNDPLGLLKTFAAAMNATATGRE